MKTRKWQLWLVLGWALLFSQFAIAGQGSISGSISHAEIEDNVYTTLKVAGDYQLSDVSTEIEYSGRLAKDSYNRNFRGKIGYSSLIGAYSGVVKRLGEIRTEIALPTAFKWQILDKDELYWIRSGIAIKKIIKGANAEVAFSLCFDTKDGENLQVGLMQSLKGQINLNDLSEILSKKLQNIAKILYIVDGYYLYRFEAESKYNIRQSVVLNRDSFYLKLQQENDSLLNKPKRLIESGIVLHLL